MPDEGFDVLVGPCVVHVALLSLLMRSSQKKQPNKKYRNYTASWPRWIRPAAETAKEYRILLLVLVVFCIYGHPQPPVKNTLTPGKLTKVKSTKANNIYIYIIYIYIY